jgi:hypothetical protein
MIESETTACGQSRVPDPELEIRFRPQAGDRLSSGEWQQKKFVRKRPPKGADEQELVSANNKKE